MPRKEQGWITFQSSDEERQILEQICQQTQRTKTEVLRELIRSMGRSPAAAAGPSTESESIEADREANLNRDSLEPTSEPTRTTAPSAIRISARNIVRARVKQIVKDTINAEVTLTIAPDVDLVSIITRTSAEQLELANGKEVFAVIKSSNVMIAEGY